MNGVTVTNVTDVNQILSDGFWHGEYSIFLTHQTNILHFPPLAFCQSDFPFLLFHGYPSDLYVLLSTQYSLDAFKLKLTSTNITKHMRFSAMAQSNTSRIQQLSV